MLTCMSLLLLIFNNFFSVFSSKMINIDRCDPHNQNPLRFSVILGVLKLKS